MKMRCDCGGEFKEQLSKFADLESEALVCQKCGYVTLTGKQADKLLKLKELLDLFHRQRKTVKIGNAVGITLPKEFVGRAGKSVKIIPIDEHTVKVKVG